MDYESRRLVQVWSRCQVIDRAAASWALDRGLIRAQAKSLKQFNIQWNEIKK